MAKKKRTKKSILKEILTECLEINSKTISETFSQLGIVFFGVSLGFIVSINLYRQISFFKTLIIIAIISFGISFTFDIIKNRKRLWELIKEL